MPWILWRHMLVQLLKTGLLTTVILVAVAAFGATIKPLADDTLLTAGQTLKYLLLVMVPMLQFALPFAAGFAATLVLHQMTSDNEIQAMAAGGLSYRRILAPLGAVAIAIFVLMLVLSQLVIPRFWDMMKATVSADVMQIFQASIDRGQSFELGDMQITADSMRVDPDPGPGVDSRLQLLRVTAARTDRDGQIVNDFTASRARIDVVRDPGVIVLSIAMANPMTYSAATGEWVRAEGWVEGSYEVPTNFSDDPDAMTLGELKLTRKEPRRFDSVDDSATRLAEVLAEFASEEVIDQRLRDGGQVTFHDGALGDQFGAAAGLGGMYVVEANRLIGGTLRGGGAPIVVTRHDERGPRWRAEARTVEIVWPDRNVEGAITGITLELNDLTIADLRSEGPVTPRTSLAIPGLSLDGAVAPAIPDSIASLKAEAVRYADGHPRVAGALARLDLEMQRVDRSLRGKLMERYAFSVTAPLIFLLGGLMSVWRRESLPLNVYLLAFFPSLIALVMIPGGRQMIKDGRAFSDLVMWSGAILLTGIIVYVILKLRRN